MSTYIQDATSNMTLYRPFISELGSFRCKRYLNLLSNPMIVSTPTMLAFLGAITDLD